MQKTFTLTLSVRLAMNGTPDEVITNNLSFLTTHAMEEGMITILSDAEVEDYNSSVTSTEPMHHITDPDQLGVGKEYWLVRKDGHDEGKAEVSVFKERSGYGYFNANIWCDNRNNQAMDKWDIFGPIEPRVEPDFEYLKRTAQ